MVARVVPQSARRRHAESRKPDLWGGSAGGRWPVLQIVEMITATSKSSPQTPPQYPRADRRPARGLLAPDYPFLRPWSGVAPYTCSWAPPPPPPGWAGARGPGRHWGRPRAAKDPPGVAGPGGGGWGE